MDVYCSPICHSEDANHAERELLNGERITHLGMFSHVPWGSDHGATP